MKSFVSPLVLIFLLLGLVLVAWALSRRRETVGSWRSWIVLWGAFTISLLLYLPATWLGSEWLRGTLASKSRESGNQKNAAWQPDWIVVLAGGMVRGATSDENVLSVESALRVGRAVTRAKDSPDAGLIFSGGLGRELPFNRGIKGLRETTPAQDPLATTRQEPDGSVVELMRELALARGIEPERCRLETASTNTMEHPNEVLALDGVEAEDRLLVVSSDWHLPRVQMVFDPVFTDIRYEGSSMKLRPGPLWKRLIPSEEALAASALYLREWVGRGWYFLRS